LHVARRKNAQKRKTIPNRADFLTAADQKTGPPGERPVGTDSKRIGPGRLM
jgi:hypothetical protein